MLLKTVIVTNYPIVTKKIITITTFAISRELTLTYWNLIERGLSYLK